MEKSFFPSISRRKFIGGALLGALSAKTLLASEPRLPMPLRSLGKNALTVSALAFGCMGLTYHRSVKLSKKEAQNILAQAIDYGITLFDTAETYGPRTNEALMGEIFAPYKNKAIISTKFGFGKDSSVLDSSPKRIREVVEGSLKRLKIEKIELLYQHRFDPKVSPETVAECVQKLIQEGKVGHFGLSEVNSAYIQRAHAVQKVAVLQSEYHLMHREVEQEIFQTLEDLNIGFVAYSPLNRGYLSGTLNEHTQFDPQNDNRPTFPRFQKEAMKANYAIIEALKNFGKNIGATPAQVALAWLLAKKPYIVALFGTTNAAHLKENVGALSLRLNNEEVSQLESTLFNIPIFGDRYPPEQQKRVGG